jgi:hypothetical protein
MKLTRSIFQVNELRKYNLITTTAKFRTSSKLKSARDDITQVLTRGIWVSVFHSLVDVLIETNSRVSQHNWLTYLTS